MLTLGGIEQGRCKPMSWELQVSMNMTESSHGLALPQMDLVTGK